MTASHGYLNDPFRGMSPEDRARAQVYVANQKAIQQRREAAARRLLAPPGPANAVKAAWAPVSDALEARQPGSAPAPMSPSPMALVPPVVGSVLLTGEGPPTAADWADMPVGTEYLDTLTGDLYTKE